MAILDGIETATFRTFEIFDNIIGHDEIKRIFFMALRAEKPVHILLVGPPGCAKTMFLQDVTETLKDQSYFIIGSSSTKAGIINALFEKRSRYLMIDEIETLSKEDQTALLNLMETGILSETKIKGTRETFIKTWIFAASNSVEKILKPLLSRFVVLQLKPYTLEEFRKIAVSKMTNEGFDCRTSNEIAENVWYNLGSTDFRDVIKISRMARNIDEVNWIIKTMNRYNETINMRSE